MSRGSTPRPEMLKRYPHQLSGGQQQRVTLAMAFACRPSLIVLDEPTTGLDVSTQRHVLETVRSMCRSYGVAAVYVSHDLAVVGGLVSQVAVMYAGRRGRDRPDRAGVPVPCPPLHARTAGGRPVTRARRGADGDRGPASSSRPQAEGLRLRAALLVRGQRLLCREARTGHHR